LPCSLGGGLGLGGWSLCLPFDVADGRVCCRIRMTQNPGKSQRVESEDVQIVAIEKGLRAFGEKVVKVIDGGFLVQTFERFLQKGML